MERLIWVLAFAALWGIGVWAMLRGRRNRGRRQLGRVGHLPDLPGDVGAQVLEPAPGLYLGSTFAPSWQDRITAGDLGDRALAELTRFEEGILLTRTAANAIWIPHDSVGTIRTERGHAGKVMGTAGVLVVRWRLPNGTEFDTGFRADDKSVYPAWVRRYERPPAQGDPVPQNGELL